MVASDCRDLSDTATWRGGFDSRNNSDRNTSSIVENAKKMRKIKDLEALLLRPYLQPPTDKGAAAAIVPPNLYEDDGFEDYFK